MSNGGRSGAEKRWTNTDNESFSQNDNDKVVQNCTTLPNQLEKIDTAITPTSAEDSKDHNKNLHLGGRVIDISARKAHVSPMTYFKGREIIKNSPEEIKDQLRKGKVKIDKVYKQLQKQLNKEELINSVPVLEFPNDNFKLVQG